MQSEQNMQDTRPTAESDSLVMSGADAPPSYDSIFGKIKDAHGTHGNSFGFVKSLATIMAASIGGIVCMAFVAAVMALPIAQLVIGLQNQEKCPINDKIPLYLIVSGGFGIAAALIQLFDGMCCRTTDEAGNRKSKCALFGFINTLINLFMFAWFICGNVWVYKIYKTVDHDDAESENYCAALPYLFAFWCITSVYIIMGATCVIGCGCMCALACLQ